MDAGKITKLEGPDFSARIQNNPASVIIDDVGALPTKLMTQPLPPPPAPNKKAIGELLKAGKEVSGAHLEHGQRLVIK
jgi:hypothetical protein